MGSLSHLLHTTLVTTPQEGRVSTKEAIHQDIAWTRELKSRESRELFSPIKWCGSGTHYPTGWWRQEPLTRFARLLLRHRGFGDVGLTDTTQFLAGMARWAERPPLVLLTSLKCSHFQNLTGMIGDELLFFSDANQSGKK